MFLVSYMYNGLMMESKHEFSAEPMPTSHWSSVKPYHAVLVLGLALPMFISCLCVGCTAILCVSHDLPIYLPPARAISSFLRLPTSLSQRNRTLSPRLLHHPIMEKLLDKTAKRLWKRLAPNRMALDPDLQARGSPSSQVTKVRARRNCVLPISSDNTVLPYS